MTKAAKVYLMKFDDVPARFDVVVVNGFMDGKKFKIEEIKHIDYGKYTNQMLKQMADNIDPNNNIHVNNRQRLERYIKEAQETNHKTIGFKVEVGV